MKHITTGTIPIHQNLGRRQQTDLFVETILPHLCSFFEEEVLPFTGARPTRYCRDMIRNVIIKRNVANVMELDPGMSKRKIYTRYGHVNGYKIVHIVDRTIIKSERTHLENKEEWEQFSICSRMSFLRF